MVTKVTSRAQGGSIVLMHLGGYNTLDALPQMVAQFQSDPQGNNPAYVDWINTYQGIMAPKLAMAVVLVQVTTCGVPATPHVHPEPVAETYWRFGSRVSVTVVLPPTAP